VSYVYVCVLVECPALWANRREPAAISRCLSLMMRSSVVSPAIAVSRLVLKLEVAASFPACLSLSLSLSLSVGLSLKVVGCG